MNREAFLQSAWVCLLLFLGLFVACRARNANRDLRLTLNTYGVEEVVVSEVPRTVSTPVALTPETLENGYHARLELKGGTLLDHLTDLDQALASTQCRKSAAASDLRTAVVSYGKGHKKIRSFYYGSGGANGQVDEVPCELSPGLYRWVRKYLPE
jgi:hypothetical protein